MLCWASFIRQHIHRFPQSLLDCFPLTAWHRGVVNTCLISTSAPFLRWGIRVCGFEASANLHMLHLFMASPQCKLFLEAGSARCFAPLWRSFIPTHSSLTAVGATVAPAKASLFFPSVWPWSVGICSSVEQGTSEDEPKDRAVFTYRYACVCVCVLHWPENPQ